MGPHCQFGLAVWPAAAPCRELLPPIVWTFTRSEPRGIERLSAPEHHRYVRVLDWTVAREFAKMPPGEMLCRLQIQGDSKFNFIFDRCERLSRDLRIVGESRLKGGCGQYWPPHKKSVAATGGLGRSLVLCGLHPWGLFPLSAAIGPCLDRDRP